MKIKLLSKIVKYNILPLCKRPRIVSRFRGKGILITFDDGPCERITKDILYILRDFKLKVLFFHIGKQIEDLLEFTKACLEEGHEVGNHSFAHKDPLLQTYSEFITDYSQAQNILSTHFNLKDSEIYYRPPRGRMNWKVLNFYRRINAKIILWSKQLDEFGESADSDGIRRSFSDLLLREGDILLLHEGSETVKALPYILEEIQKSKLKVLSGRDAVGH